MLVISHLRNEPWREINITNQEHCR